MEEPRKIGSPGGRKEAIPSAAPATPGWGVLPAGNASLATPRASTAPGFGTSLPISYTI